MRTTSRGLTSRFPFQVQAGVLWLVRTVSTGELGPAKLPPPVLLVLPVQERRKVNDFAYPLFRHVVQKSFQAFPSAVMDFSLGLQYSRFCYSKLLIDKLLDYGDFEIDLHVVGFVQIRFDAVG